VVFMYNQVKKKKRNVSSNSKQNIYVDQDQDAGSLRLKKVGSRSGQNLFRFATLLEIKNEVN
jgi:hypothetical protein